MRHIKRLIELIMRLAEMICMTTMTVMVVVLFLQVLCRYVFKYSIAWSEELGRYLFIWNVFVGAGLAAFKRAHIRVEIVFNLFRGVPRKILGIAIKLSVLSCLAIVFWKAVAFISLVKSRLTPALQISAGLVSLAVPVGILLMILAFIYRLIEEYELGSRESEYDYPL